MTSTISIRFYSVEKLQSSGPTLKQALDSISERDHNNRQVQLTSGLVVRLERYETDAGELVGEFTRVSETNFPFEVQADGVKALQTDGPLGTGVAFRFRPSDHTLAIQYDTRIVPPGRAIEYLMQFDRRFAYLITPKLDTLNWRKFNNHPVRKLRIGIASPQNLGEIENTGAMVKSSLQRLGEAYSAPVITIEIGMGQRKGSLNEAAKELARSFSSLFVRGEADIRSLRGTIKMADDLPSEEINLIDEILSERLEFPSPRNDPERNYELRRSIVKQALLAHV